MRLYDKGVDVRPGQATYVDFASAMTIRSGDIHIPKIDMQEPLLKECEHFVESVLSGKTPRSDGDNGYAVVRIMEAAQTSMKNGGIKVEL